MGALFVLTVLLLGALLASAWHWWEQDREHREADARALREWREFRDAARPTWWKP